MKEALKAILFAKELSKIIDGSQTVTIRLGHRDYKVGDDVVLCCHIDNWAILAKTVRVVHTCLGSVLIEDLIKGGYRNTQEAINDLSSWYPNINFDSEVTVIEFGELKGTLVK